MRRTEVWLEERTDGAAGSPEQRFGGLVAEYAPSLQRLARGYEADQGRQQELVQEILVAVWRALPAFEARASMRTWLFRIAHNVAVSHLVKRGRDRLAGSVPIDDEAHRALAGNAVREAEGRDSMQRLAAQIRALRPADAQLIVLYLEGLQHAEIAEVTGLSRENVAVRVHRIKAALLRAHEDGEAK